ncbi:MAG: DNA circularization N-terminal domain-containing protein, partial [Planctomycetes bacterium]|nr:DNA circularization N-terminal domain-containing protein [Planctomycetota bacterium]
QPVTWRDRLRETVKLTSPEGNIFEAKWQGNSRSKDKKLGLFEFPKVKGTKVQDLDIGSTKYPLTIFFDGENNDQESDRFFKACDERGAWNVVHPVRGALDLQLISVTENIQPVESGNVTQFDLEWIEPLEDSEVSSLFQQRSTIDSQIDEVNSAASDQIDGNILQKTAAQVAAFEATVSSVVSAVEKFLAPIYELQSEVNAQILSVKRGVNSLLAAPVLDVVSIAGQIQTLVQLPALAIADINSRVDAYQNFINAALTFSPETAQTKDRNIVAVQELALTSGLAAISFVSSTGELASRLQAIELIEANAELFKNITDTLDGTQELFKDEIIDGQYFSQSESYSDALLMISQTIAYLLRSAFDLSIEKRFVLEKMRAPIEITISEYGDLGENDINFDLFIESNSLKGNEILILPEGREVLVYV